VYTTDSTSVHNRLTSVHNSLISELILCLVFGKSAKFLRKYEILEKAPGFEKAQDFGKSTEYSKSARFLGKCTIFKKSAFL
jgi:hypothetical protein